MPLKYLTLSNLLYLRHDRRIHDRRYDYLPGTKKNLTFAAVVSFLNQHQAPASP